MQKPLLKKGIAVAVIVLFIGMIITPSTGTVLEKSTLSFDGKTLYVGGDGPGNYSKIQDAIDDASDGDTIFVYDDSSPYVENIVVDKSISLIGENKYTTVIDGDDIGDVVHIYAHWVNISRFTIQNGYDGVDIDSDYNTITGNIISNNGWGISLYESSNTITGNTIISNNHGGIRLDWFSSSNTITGNTILNNGCGIKLYNSSNNNITGNNIISNNRWGIELDTSSSNNIAGNTISNNGDGIWVLESSNNNITGNNIISNNRYGISLPISSDNTITGKTPSLKTTIVAYTSILPAATISSLATTSSRTTIMA